MIPLKLCSLRAQFHSNTLYKQQIIVYIVLTGYALWGYLVRVGTLYQSRAQTPPAKGLAHVSWSCAPSRSCDSWLAHMLRICLYIGALECRSRMLADKKS